MFDDTPRTDSGQPERATARALKPARSFPTRDEILSRLNVRAEFEELGVRFTDHVSPSGWFECHAFDREDNNPSAAVNIKEGRYVDHGDTEKSGDLFDLAYRSGIGRLSALTSTTMRPASLFTRRVGIEIRKGSHRLKRPTAASRGSGAWTARRSSRIACRNCSRLRPTLRHSWSKARRTPTGLPRSV